MFVVVTIAIIRFSTGDDEISSDALSGMLWIVIFFSLSGGLSRIFVKEEEKETATALKLSTDGINVYTGKLLFNLFISFLLNVIIIVLFIGATNLTIKNYTAFLIVIFLGSCGLVSTSTIIASIIAKANSKGMLFPVLSFPILLPLLVVVTNATKLAVNGVATSQLYSDFMLIISFTVIITVLSLMLFKFIWEDI